MQAYAVFTLRLSASARSRQRLFPSLHRGARSAYRSVALVRLEHAMPLGALEAGLADQYDAGGTVTCINVGKIGIHHIQPFNCNS